MEQTTTLIGTYAPDFEIPGIDDAVHHLARYLENFRAVGVVFMGSQCPYVSLYLERLKQIQTTFEHQGFILVGINPNDASLSPADSFEQMKVFAQDRALNFPYLRDVTQDVARGFKAQTTPTVFLIDQQAVVRYGGSIDDNPDDPGAVQSRYLETAIAQLLQGQPITYPTTDAIGCPIQWRPQDR